LKWWYIIKSESKYSVKKPFLKIKIK